MDEKSSTGFFFALVIGLLVFNYFVSGVLLAFVPFFGQTLPIFIIPAVGLFTGWMANSVMQHFNMGPERRIICAIVLSTSILLIMFFVGFMLQGMSPLLDQRVEDNGGYDITELLMPKISMFALFATAILYLVAFNFPTAKQIYSENKKLLIINYSIASAIWIILVLITRYILSTVLVTSF